MSSYFKLTTGTIEDSFAGKLFIESGVYNQKRIYLPYQVPSHRGINYRKRGKWAVYYTRPQSYLIAFLIRWLQNFEEF